MKDIAIQGAAHAAAQQSASREAPELTCAVLLARARRAYASRGASP